MPSLYGFAKPGAGEPAGTCCGVIGLTPGEETGLDPSMPGSFGGIGLPIAINSETVTNLNPLA